MKKHIKYFVMMVVLVALVFPTISMADDAQKADPKPCCGAEKLKIEQHPVDCTDGKDANCDPAKMDEHHKTMMKDHPEDCKACQDGTCDHEKMDGHHKAMMDKHHGDMMKEHHAGMMDKKTDGKGCVGSDCIDGKKGTDSAMKTEPKEGNVWYAADGQKYFKCPVMKGEGLVAEAEAFSVVDGVKYYHCCPPCQGPFRKDPDKWLGELFLPGNIEKVDAGVKTYKDPVNGKMDEVKETTRFFDYEGYRYFFSSKRNMKKFEKDPSQYLGNMHS